MLLGRGAARGGWVFFPVFDDFPRAASREYFILILRRSRGGKAPGERAGSGLVLLYFIFHHHLRAPPSKTPQALPKQKSEGNPRCFSSRREFWPFIFPSLSRFSIVPIPLLFLSLAKPADQRRRNPRLQKLGKPSGISRPNPAFP